MTTLRRTFLKTLLGAALMPVAIQLAPLLRKPVEVVAEEPTWLEDAELAAKYLDEKGYHVEYGVDWSKNNGRGAWVVIEKNTESNKMRVIDYGDITGKSERYWIADDPEQVTA